MVETEHQIADAPDLNETPDDAEAAIAAPETSCGDADETPRDEAAETPAHDPADEVDERGFIDAALHLRMLEALLFAAAEPLDEATLASRMPRNADLPVLLEELEAAYKDRGVNLVKISEKWALRTASDLAFLLRKETSEQKRLSRAGVETLAIVAYHQPVTRAEIEEIRGVGVSKGTLDLLLEIGWVRLRGRRRTPGRPVTYGTTDAFLQHFSLERLGDLPGMDELKAAGLLDSSVPAGFNVPTPSDALAPDEDPLDETDISELLAPGADDE